MSDNYTKRAQQNMNAEIGRNAAREEARRNELAERRRGEQEQREEQRRADAADPGVQRFLRESEQRRQQEELAAHARRAENEATQAAREEAELEKEKAFRRNIHLANGGSEASFEEAWPGILERQRAEATEADAARRERLRQQDAIF